MVGGGVVGNLPNFLTVGILQLFPYNNLYMYIT